MFAITIVGCSAQDYDDDGYGNQGGGSNQGDNDNYGAGYGNDDSYSGNAPNYQQGVDSDGSNNNPSNSYPSSQGGSDADGDYEGEDSTAAAAASAVSPTIIKRSKRSTLSMDEIANKPNAPVSAASEPKLRVKRHGKYYIGPVYTYVKTDKHANFKWGVSNNQRSFF